MSSTKLWLIVAAFVIGTLVPTFYLIATTGSDDRVPLDTAELNFDVSPDVPPSTPQAARAPSPALQPSPTPERQTAPPPANVAPTPLPLAPAPAATASPPPPPPAPQAQGVPALNGRFRIVDTVTEGEGAGLVVSFDVDLRQSGSTVSGGNDEISLSGQVEANTARVQFVQPRLGYTGTFLWLLNASGGSGTFSSSVPNRGTSQLVRMQ